MYLDTQLTKKMLIATSAYWFIKIFISHIDTIGSIIQRHIWKENPVILICPNEDYENGSPVYYSNETYIWLSDSFKIKDIQM